MSRCEYCDGRGYTIHYSIPWGLMDYTDPPEREQCEDCGGTGWQPDDELPEGFDEHLHTLAWMRHQHRLSNMPEPERSMPDELFAPDGMDNYGSIR